MLCLLFLAVSRYSKNLWCLVADFLHWFWLILSNNLHTLECLSVTPGKRQCLVSCVLYLSWSQEFTFSHFAWTSFRCTLADPTCWLASDVVGDKSEQSHATHFRTLRQAPIRICRMCTFTSAGTVKGSYLLKLPVNDSCIVHVVISDWPTASRGSPDEAPTADVGSETHSHYLSRERWDVSSANVQRA